MSIKWIGAIFVILGCGGFGFSLAASQLREERCLRQLIHALDLMACELQYRLTPLPELCRLAGEEVSGCIRQVFLALSRELDAQISPDVSSCMCAALQTAGDLPLHTRQNLLLLGRSLGRFDLPGQIEGLDAVRSACREELEAITTNKEPRLRSYQTLGICAGAALAILFI